MQLAEFGLSGLPILSDTKHWASIVEQFSIKYADSCEEKTKFLKNFLPLSA